MSVPYLRKLPEEWLEAAREAVAARTLKVGRCWLWTGHINDSGYGLLILRRHRMRAHRAAWQLSGGDLPPGMSVCHTCDNPWCVRPEHLFLGTHQENMRDGVRKGRVGGRAGELAGRAKLSNADVRAIRLRIHSGEACTKIAQDYPVCAKVIQNIRKGKIWQSVQ